MKMGYGQDFQTRLWGVLCGLCTSCGSDQNKDNKDPNYWKPLCLPFVKCGAVDFCGITMFCTQWRDSAAPEQLQGCGPLEGEQGAFAFPVEGESCLQCRATCILVQVH